MHKIAVVSGAPMIAELMQRFEEASIDAMSATERNVLELHVGGVLSASIWVKDVEDVPRAREIFREVQAERTVERTAVVCPGCSYDLRGHSGETTCPECGVDITAPQPDQQCPQCHEVVPYGFELCWNCEADLRDRNQRDA